MEKLPVGKKRLLDFLGEPYRSKLIDMELCVYLDMGKHDIEIARGSTLRRPFDIYVWCKQGGLQIVERYMDIPNNLPKVKELLDDIRGRYETGCSDHCKNCR